MWWFNSLWDNWGTWITLAGAIAALAALSVVAKPLAVVIEAISPIIKVAAEAVAGGAKWLWTTILGPGLKDIFDDWVTVATVAIVGGMLYWGIWTYMDVRMDMVVDQLSTCQSEVTKLQKSYGVGKSTKPDWFWPLW